MDPVFSGSIQGSTADAAHRRREEGCGDRRRSSRGGFPHADYVSNFPGGAPALAAALPKGLAVGDACRRDRLHRPSPPDPSHRRSAARRAISSSSRIQSPVLGDGRGANKPWLQELPDPVTKITWSSWVEMHPETAQRLGIDRGDILEVKTANGTVRAPAFPYLGIHKDAIAIPTGQGHRADGFDADVRAEEPRSGASAVGLRPLRARPRRERRSICSRSAPTRRAVSSSRPRRPRSRRRATTITLPSTEGSARQHGRGIAQRGQRGRASASRRPRRREERFPATRATSSCPGCGRPSRRTRRAISARRPRRITARTRACTIPNNPLGMAKRRWAMTVDLARCTGCSACVTACYAENNIPTVGAPLAERDDLGRRATAGLQHRARPRDELDPPRALLRGRIRDGKFGEDFETRFVPMLCQHCGNAPCEPVCPVYATYHSPDGLNVQVYNRCVGTRYCSQQLPVQGPLLQLVRVRRGGSQAVRVPRAAQLAAQSRRDRARQGRDGEVHVLRAAHSRDGESRGARGSRARSRTSSRRRARRRVRRAPSRSVTRPIPNWTVAHRVDDRRAYHVFEELNTFTAVVYLKKVNHPAGAAAPRA